MSLTRILIVMLLLFHCRPVLAESTWKDALPFRSLVMAQNGMYPTIEKGERVIARAGVLFERNELRRGDVVYFYRTIDGIKYIFIWRIVAMPGDLLEIDPAGQIKINGRSLHLEKDSGAKDGTIYRESNGDVSYRISLSGESKSERPVSLTVPSGHVYLLGDNRNHAADSRYHGPVSIDSIYGVVR